MAIATFSAGAPTSGNGLVTEDQLNDLVLAERAFELALSDSADIFDTPAVVMSDATGSGSLVQRHRTLTLGWGVSMDAVANENTSVSASSVTAAAIDVTVARRSLRFDETGLARAVGGAWGFDPISLGLTMVDSFRAGRMGAACTAVAAASTNITSATDGDIDDLYDVIDSFTAATGDPGLLIGLFHPVTLSAIRDTVRAESGPTRERADFQAFLAKGAEVLLGMLLFPSTKVTTAASHYENAVMTPGALSYAMAQPQSMIGGSSIIAQPSDMPLSIAVERNEASDEYRIIAHAYDGISIREDARIRGVISDV